MDFLSDIFTYKNHDVICGLTEELAVLYYYNYFKKYDRNVLIVTNTLFDSNKIFQRLKTYTNEVCLFPMDDFLSSVAIALSPDLKVKRLSTLEEIKKGKPRIVVTNLTGYLHFLPSLTSSKELQIKLHKNDSISREELLERLERFGYKRDSIVTSTGEYAVRGYIIDIFPIESEHPIRIEFFGDDIDSIRYFNENTQLSINEVDNTIILPFDEVETDNKSSLYDYLDKPFVFMVNKNQITLGYNKLIDDIKEYKESKEVDPSHKYMFNMEDIIVDESIEIDTVNNLVGSHVFNSKPILKFKGNFDAFIDFVNKEVINNTVIICLSKEKQIEKVKPLFKKVNVGSIKEQEINIINKEINEGFMIGGYCIISEYDIDDEKITSVYKNNYKMGTKIHNFNDIKPGDYVVHSQHGIGIYGGIVPIEKQGMTRDYILINYAGNDKVYIPVEKINTIYKYNEADGHKPTVNKLNSTQWAKIKMRARNRIHDISEELIKLYAARAKVQGPKFKDFPEEAMFENQFVYTETMDQLKCIKEIDKDLSTHIPMDRLLCGDVGFGKTEVAFRGMFKAVLNGYQVAYLCPTTLLSRQQYLSAMERFKEFPVNIALLNRFTTPREVKRIEEGLARGTIDIVFGTHKLLNKEIVYKNLGLLVIDEEQRFGVSQKEKIKELKNDVNVLTLSATPIPRTLKMAMSGLRDLSIIDTAPVNRYPVQTYVVEENDFLIKDAIYKELTRGGQVFLLYNKVSSIADIHTKIKTLVPEARVVVAHGQMNKYELEEVVKDFVEQKYDILICTTIIETGIDIPNVNTLIVLDSDNFGLSQLYQLRGRVGRSNKIAYAYLMYKPSKILTETAKKRLESIKDFTELGSGYKIAMRDLSIRGAGDMLGSEQAGFIDAIGLELYTQMVNNEIKRLNGEEVSDDEEASNPLIEVSNHIKDEYVSDENIKIEIHKMINEIKDEKSLESIKSEIEDRFGKIDDDMEVYMYEEWFEKIAENLHITNVSNRDNLLKVELPEDVSNKIDGEKLFLITYNIYPKFRLSYMNKKITIILPLVNIPKHFIYYIVELLMKIEDMIK